MIMIRREPDARESPQVGCFRERISGAFLVPPADIFNPRNHRFMKKAWGWRESRCEDLFTGSSFSVNPARKPAPEPYSFPYEAGKGAIRPEPSVYFRYLYN
jgi:hypothetical protein